MRILLAVLFLVSCSTPSPPDSPSEKSTLIEEALAGTPDSSSVQAGDALTAQLTQAELQHLAEIDWRTMTTEGFFGDPMIRRAVAIVEPVVPVSQKPFPGDVCAGSVRAIEEGVLRTAAAFITNPVVVGTCLATAITGVGAPICIGAAIGTIIVVARNEGLGTTVANALDQCLCEVIPPCDMPDGGVAPDAPEV